MRWGICLHFLHFLQLGRLNGRELPLLSLLGEPESFRGYSSVLFEKPAEIRVVIEIKLVSHLGYRELGMGQQSLCLQQDTLADKVSG